MRSAVAVPPELLRRPELRPLAHALGDAAADARAAYRATLARNVLLGHALDQILAALGERDIPVQPLKGALLLETVYGGDAGARPMSDLDLLVPVGAVERAHAALVELGFQPQGAERLRWAPRFHHHRIFQRPGAMVELHWGLLHELGIDGDGAPFFTHARELPFRGRTLPIARDELLVWYTLVHAAAHALMHSAVWIVDAVLQVTANPALDWDWLMRHARERRSERAVLAAARLVERHFPGVLPIAGGRAGVRDRLLERLLDSTATPIEYGSNARSLAIRFLLTDRLSGAAQLMLDKATLRLFELGERRLNGSR